MTSFKAVRLEQAEGGDTTAALVDFPLDQLMDGDVTVRVARSGLNYKDGLALTGRAPVVRRWPMIPGIDLAGTVESSDSPAWKKGDKIVVTGWGIGETHLGGYAELARLKSDWLLPLPDGFTAEESMAIGTAGLTAMLAVLALERFGMTPASGPVLVTGASGGLGSIAIALLAKAGFSVTASTGRTEEADYLKSLGAAEVIDRAELSGEPRPLAKERWACAVDSVGGITLANVLSMTRRRGPVAACGNAGGMALPTTVAPFILRGVALLGIDSVFQPNERRREAWARLMRDLDREKLAGMTQTIPLAKVIDAAPEILAGRVRGRIVVDTTR
jgi:acrylyl-CoA reductase (NADPH)